MGSVRWSVSTSATSALRFDDVEFIEALVADAGKEGSPLAKLLEVEVATDADLSAFVDDGVVIHARHGITAGEEDALYTGGVYEDARKGVRPDVGRFNQTWFATWVTGVTADDPAAVPAGLSNRARRTREDAVAALPVPVRAALFARLRVHVDSVNRPAMRDPKLSRQTPDSD